MCLIISLIPASCLSYGHSCWGGEKNTFSIFYGSKFISQLFDLCSLFYTLSHVQLTEKDPTCRSGNKTRKRRQESQVIDGVFLKLSLKE